MTDHFPRPRWSGPPPPGGHHWAASASAPAAYISTRVVRKLKQECFKTKNHGPGRRKRQPTACGELLGARAQVIR